MTDVTAEMLNNANDANFDESKNGFIYNGHIHGVTDGAEVVVGPEIGEREMRWDVRTVIRIGDKFFAVDGRSDSWEGPEWGDWYEVKPVEKTITEYIRL